MLWAHLADLTFLTKPLIHWWQTINTIFFESTLGDKCFYDLKYFKPYDSEMNISQMVGQVSDVEIHQPRPEAVGGRQRKSEKPDAKLAIANCTAKAAA